MASNQVLTVKERVQRHQPTCSTASESIAMATSTSATVRCRSTSAYGRWPQQHVPVGLGTDQCRRAADARVYKYIVDQNRTSVSPGLLRERWRRHHLFYAPATRRVPRPGGTQGGRHHGGEDGRRPRRPDQGKIRRSYSTKPDPCLTDNHRCPGAARPPPPIPEQDHPSGSPHSLRQSAVALGATTLWFAQQSATERDRASPLAARLTTF